MKRFKKELSLLLVMALVLTSICFGVGGVKAGAVDQATGQLGYFYAYLETHAQTCAGTGTDAQLIIDIVYDDSTTYSHVLDDVADTTDFEADDNNTCYMTADNTATGAWCVPAKPISSIKIRIHGMAAAPLGNDDWDFDAVRVFYHNGIDWDEIGVCDTRQTLAAEDQTATLTYDDSLDTLYNKTLTFNSNGGTPAFTQIFSEQAATLPAGNIPAVTKTGYTFNSWVPAVPDIGPGAATTYTAQWVPKTYTVTFDPQGGSVSPAASTVTYNSTYGAGTGGWPTPAKAGSNFDGWYTAAGGGGTQILTGTTVTITAAQTLYAKWTGSSSFTVSFNLNNGTGTIPAAQTGIPGTNVTLPLQGDIARSFYNFLGWATTSGATTPLSSYSIPSANAMLYAVWSRVPVTLTAKAGSATIINQSKGFIFGLEEGLTKTNFTSNFVKVNGDGELHITYYDADFGSGTKVELFDKVTLSVVKTYYIVIFGDVDGDGYITGSDENLIGLVASYQSEFAPGSAFEYAADLTQDEIVDTFDVNIISASTSYTGVIDQTNPGVLI